MAEVSKTSFFKKDIVLGKPLNDKFKEHFYGEFATLIESGIDMRRALQLIIDEQEKKNVRGHIETLLEDLVKGNSLSESMQKSAHFTPYEYQSIRIGEESGRLKNVLFSLSNYFASKVKLKRQLVSVFTYPAFVFSITVGVLYFMLNFVVPMFKDVFKQFGQELPWLTLKIVWLSENFGSFIFWFLLIGLGTGFYLFSQKNEDWFRKFSGNFILKIPIFGKLIQKIYIARFCQSMALLLEAKTPLVKALDLVSEMIRFYPMQQTILAAKAEILAGNSLHEGLSKFEILDKRLISLIKIAEEINQLDQTFHRLTIQYNEEIEYRTKMIGTIIEPAIIVIIGVIVGVIMVSMYLPMFNLSNVIK
ncbi:type II secretion system F family protein [Fluviicola sp.]|uniref:type II secretion system F family protein n=1 Tax=Fluviicola sp. TaxID=1917219 RepID=UPI003D2D083F